MWKIIHLLCMLVNKTLNSWRDVTVLLLNITGFFVNDCTIVTVCFLSAKQRMYPLVLPISLPFCLIVTLTPYQHLFLSDWLMIQILLWYDAASAWSIFWKCVPKHAQPKALLCNHTKYVGNPFYLHTFKVHQLLAHSSMTSPLCSFCVPAEINWQPLRSDGALIK